MATEKRLQTRKTEEQKRLEKLAAEKRSSKLDDIDSQATTFPRAVIIQPIYLKDGRLTECAPLT